MQKKSEILAAYRDTLTVSYTDAMMFTFVLKVFKLDSFLLEFLHVILGREDIKIDQTLKIIMNSSL